MANALRIQFWKTFPILAIFPLALCALAYHWEMAELHEGLERQQRAAVVAGAEATARRLNGIAAVTLLLRDQNELNDYLASGERRLLAEIAHEYLVIARHTADYDQLRYIDETGMEVVRVNFNGGDPVVVPDAELQDKRDRYYFSNTMAVADGEICASPLDLNIEHGEIEHPYKPMIRLATPVLDAHARKRGIVIVNYLAQSILDVAKASMAHGPSEAMMLNGEGYWLLSPDPDREWGFMFPDRRDARLEVVYPEVWAAMQQRPAGHLHTQDGLFTFLASDALDTPFRLGVAELGPRCGQGPRQWYFLVHLPQAQLATLRMKIVVPLVMTATVVLLLLAFVYREILIVQHQRRTHRTQLERLARFDSLTGIANRTSFLERLEQAYEGAQSRRTEHRFALLYIDLDGFKEINDNLGHLAGDQVLKDVADTLSANCRKGDTVGRYGGDEFVVLLLDIPDVAMAAAIARKLRDQVNALSWSGLRVGASIGVAVYPDHARRLQELIRVADEAMYVAKTAGKNRVAVAKPLTTSPHV